jgi:hypothetical protein
LGNLSFPTRIDEADISIVVGCIIQAFNDQAHLREQEQMDPNKYHIDAVQHKSRKMLMIWMMRSVEDNGMQEEGESRRNANVPVAPCLDNTTDGHDAFPLNNRAHLIF